jgi:hypothetical protein
MPLGPARQAAALALALTAVVRAAAVGQFCYTIEPGDTAAYIALRLTGSVEHRSEPWFQIVDPRVPRIVPKAGYGRILPGWRVCVPDTRLTDEWRRRSGLDAALSGAAIGAESAAADASVLGWIGAVVTVLLLALFAWRTSSTRMKRRQAATRAMQSFAERFIAEFERPLRQPGDAARPLQSRMRVAPRQRRVDILLAPHGGRSYPNLSDHRANVKYDVGRVLKVMSDARFTAGDVYARGRWVVVPCRLMIEPTEEGGS